MKIEELPVHLGTVDPTAWEQLYGLTLAIYKENDFGAISESKKPIEGYIEFPHWEYPDKIGDFVKMVYSLNIVLSFDWLEWKEGLSTLQDRNQDFSDFDPVTLCKYITLIVRAERFYEGYLHNCFENGSVLKIITALTRSQKLINPQ